MQRRVGDALDDLEHVQLGRDLAEHLEERVGFRQRQQRGLGRAQRRLGLLKVAPRDALVVGNVERLHDLLARHERLGRLLRDLGRLGLLAALLVVVVGPVERFGHVGVVQALHLLLALLLEEQL